MMPHAELIKRWAVTLLVSGGVAVICTAAILSYVNQQQRESRDAAIALAIKVQHVADAKSTEKIYRSQLAACGREQGVRRAVRRNAQANQTAFDTLAGFFTGARGRALAQSKDPNISAVSRAAAGKSLASIDHAIGVFSQPLTIPPKPLPCTEVIDDPNAPAQHGP